MSYDNYLADRIRNFFIAKGADFYEKKMFGGLCFMVNDKMFCGIHFEKKVQQDLIMARIGKAVYEAALKKPGVLPMDFTGRPMKGYVFVQPEGYDLESDFEYWMQLCLDFNPQAKVSAKRRK